MRAKRLGRGLSNLINKTDDETPEAVQRRTAPPPTERDVPIEELGPAVATLPTVALPPGAPGVQTIPTAEVRSNPFQPRTTFTDDALAEFSASIAEHGILQPIVVRALRPEATS